MKKWFVAQTQPGKEFIAKDHLDRQSFTSFLPLFKKIISHARQRKEVLRPLFPGYIFVQIDVDADQWRSINGTRGISYLLTHDDHKPTSLPNEIVETLKAEQEQNGAIELSSISCFIKGETIRVTEGVFEDQVATFESLGNKDRAQILLNFMNRTLTVEVPLASVEKLD